MCIDEFRGYTSTGSKTYQSIAINIVNNYHAVK